MAYKTENVALLDSTGKVEYSRLQAIADAVQTQTQRDLAPIWGVSAIVKAFKSPNDVPKGWWTATVMTEITEGENLNGVHWYSTIDGVKVPYAKIRYTDWRSLDFFESNMTKVISEEIIEMLIDPVGDNKVKGKDPEDPSKQDVEFLVEIGDPVQAFNIGYYIGDVFVTNFIYPSYFFATKQEGVKYDHLGIFTEPKQLAEGGYQIFERAGEWWQAWKVSGKLYFIKQGEALPETANSNILIITILVVAYLTIGCFFLLKWLLKSKK